MLESPEPDLNQQPIGIFRAIANDQVPQYSTTADRSTIELSGVIYKKYR